MLAVAKAWADQGGRLEWDGSLSDSQYHTKPDTGEEFIYVAKKPLSWITPGRNFVYKLFRFPGAVVVSNLTYLIDIMANI